MKQELPDHEIKTFGYQIRDQIKAMHYSPLLRKMVQEYAINNDWKSKDYYSHSSKNNLVFHVDANSLYKLCINEQVDELDKLCYTISSQILNKINYYDMCFVLTQERFTDMYLKKNNLVIEVINGAYKSSEIRAIPY